MIHNRLCIKLVIFLNVLALLLTRALLGMTKKQHFDFATDTNVYIQMTAVPSFQTGYVHLNNCAILWFKEVLKLLAGIHLQSFKILF